MRSPDRKTGGPGRVRCRLVQDLTLNGFRNRVGSRFEVADTDVEVECVGVRETGPHSFSVLFHGPVDVVLPQATYSFRADLEPDLAIFVVPLGPSDDVMVYEAVFARMPQR